MIAEKLVVVCYTDYGVRKLQESLYLNLGIWVKGMALEKKQKKHKPSMRKNVEK